MTNDHIYKEKKLSYFTFSTFRSKTIFYARLQNQHEGSHGKRKHHHRSSCPYKSFIINPIRQKRKKETKLNKNRGLGLLRNPIIWYNFTRVTISTLKEASAITYAIQNVNDEPTPSFPSLTATCSATKRH